MVTMLGPAVDAGRGQVGCMGEQAKARLDSSVQDPCTIKGSVLFVSGA
jgi:hypothetical protein